MSQFYKMRLAIIISIICIVLILLNADRTFAFCDAHSEPCFERIKTFDKIDDHFVRNYFFDYADDVFIHYDWPNKSDNVANNFDGFPAVYCFEIIANDEPHFLMANWIDHKSISNIVDMYVPELCEQSLNPVNSENRPNSLYVNKPMKTLDPKPNELVISTPNFHPDDLQSCLHGGFDDKNYEWCNNYKEKVKSEAPLKQVKLGIPINEIQCKKNLVLIQKHDETSACVTPETKEKLVKRGWTNLENTLETENLWKSTEEWNSLRLVRNSDDGLYCSSNEELSDHCYSLEEIVFGNGHKRSNQGWKVYPGAGKILPDNTTLTPVYKNSTLGLPQIDLNAMLDDKTFVDRCQSHGGTWNHSRHDCEGLMQVCNDIGGIYLNEDVTPPCTDTGIIDEDPLKVKVCRGAALIRVSCVFEYEG